MSTEQITRVRRTGKVFYALSSVLVLIGIGGFGTASSGNVTMFGFTMEAKYACFIYFVLGAACLWLSLEGRRRIGRDPLRGSGGSSS